MGLGQIEEDLINLAKISKTGTPLYFVLESYKLHPDYIEIMMRKNEKIDNVDKMID